jgi:hypothetical protein
LGPLLTKKPSMRRALVFSYKTRGFVEDSGVVCKNSCDIDLFA